MYVNKGLVDFTRALVSANAGDKIDILPNILTKITSRYVRKPKIAPIKLDVSYKEDHINT